jgi:hypothetical protein
MSNVTTMETDAAAPRHRHRTRPSDHSVEMPDVPYSEANFLFSCSALMVPTEGERRIYAGSIRASIKCLTL